MGTFRPRKGVLPAITVVPPADINARAFAKSRPIGEDRFSAGQADKSYYFPPEVDGHAHVSVHATGIAGGCNTGGLFEWAGRLTAPDLYEDVQSNGNPVPLDTNPFLGC